METAAIGHRVADFLKQHAPFNAIDEADLLALAGGGRVRFYEPNDYVLWQGEPHRSHVFVIQQGTVSLWEEMAGTPMLRDVRGAGDLLGVERYHDATACLYTVRSESEVVVYAFAATDFEACVLEYPHAVRFVEAEGRVTADYRAAGARVDLSALFLQSLVGRGELPRCAPTDSVADAARRLRSSRAEALVVGEAGQRAQAVLTADRLLQWITDGGGDPGQPVASLVDRAPVTVPPDATVADGLLTMGTEDVEAVAVTDDGTPAGAVQAVVTRWDLAPLFGDTPHALLDAARTATTTEGLRRVNQRTRALILDRLDGAASVDWLTRLAGLVDGTILARLAELVGFDASSAALLVGGASGRMESLTAAAPVLLAVHAEGASGAAIREQFQRVHEGLTECGYIPQVDPFQDADFAVTSAGDWKDRYRAWIGDPVQQAYQVRSLFDVRSAHGRHSLWHDIASAATGMVTSDFLYLLANDCLDSLPPLTFFEDAVVDSSGEHATTFRLEHSALTPLVDVGRVFGLAARDVFGRATADRFAGARALLPEQDAIFREAADTLRIVLWQQGRVGITEGTAGVELPPALLSRYDRRSLKSGFRSIRRLIEFTADLSWLGRL